MPSEIAGEAQIGSRADGFSLTEMLVVLSILAAATSLAMPVVFDSSGRRALDRSTRELAGLFREARSVASEQARESAVRFIQEESRFAAGWAERFVAMPAGAHVTITSARQASKDNSGSTVMFFPAGNSTGGVIRMRLRESEATLTIDWLTGKATVERPQ